MARKTVHSPEQIAAVLEEISRSQTDRGAAVVGAAVLEEILEITLQKRMVQLNREHYKTLFNFNGPAGTFSNKIELFFAFGLCNEAHYQILHQVRAIRNKFAHSIEPLTFDDENIAPLVDELGLKPSPYPARREHFSGIIGSLMMIMYALGEADIRIKNIGDTHPRIYIDLIKGAAPGHADAIEAIWQAYQQGLSDPH